MSGSRRRVTLVTSNGWGLGHLSRETAIALAMGDTAEVTMFSFSKGLPLAVGLGVRGEFCQGHSTPWIPRERWNEYVERRFRLFISEVGTDVVLFDGVAPYPGILQALSDQPQISAGWLRRGMWLRSRTQEQLAKSPKFDFVIEPGDLAADADHGPTAGLDAIRVPPVSLLEVVPMLDREEAASQLGLDPTRPTLLIAIGLGQDGATAAVRHAALQQTLDHGGWQVGLVNSPLTTREPDEVPGVVQLEGVFPLMRHLTAFDAAVSAAGYNSVHELIPAGIPTLLLPKSASRTDDQIARASYLANHGMALMANDGDVEGVRSQVEKLLGTDGEGLRKTLSATGIDRMTGGAREIAKFLAESPPTGRRDLGPEETVQRGFKGFVKRAIGPTGVALVQRVLGRTPGSPSRNVVSTNPDDAVDTLLITSDLDAVRRSTEVAVEHLLPGSRPDYERARREMIDDFYEVVD